MLLPVSTRPESTGTWTLTLTTVLEHRGPALLATCGRQYVALLVDESTDQHAAMREMARRIRTGEVRSDEHSGGFIAWERWTPPAAGAGAEAEGESD